MTSTKTQLFKVQCGRCSGKGILDFHLGVMGGVCFKCGGCGFNMLKRKPGKPQQKFSISAFNIETQSTIQMFNVSANTEAAACKKASNTLPKDKWDMTTITAQAW